MASYVVGDLQGCLEPLRRGLDALAFDPTRDRLWLVGDLVNRGPDSLGTLRFLRSLGEAVQAVLGNHDLHLLALLLGGRSPSKKDTLTKILDAEDREMLTAWLRAWPLLHYDDAYDVVMVHAGIPPGFDLAAAQAGAAEVATKLRGSDGPMFLSSMYGNEPRCWSETLSGLPRLRWLVNAFTRMRVLDADNGLDLTFKGPLTALPSGRRPWFDVLHGDFAARRVLFGHWAALAGEGVPAPSLALDTGCVWGGALTFYCLDNGAFHREEACP
ncbi:MAG: symmetrical bis(5'-nucleosyl)-tetraphosphatase [Pseudomonadota bacterium]|nr:symmetrical bis(5'-nucleosyl)-tetraphosphatase [Pseudomonadota bacterium]